MRLSKIIDHPSLGDVTIKELTVKELDETPVNESTMLDRILDRHEITGDLLAESTSINIDVLSGYTPSCLRPLVDAFKEVNPDFLEMKKSEQARVEEYLKAKNLEEVISDPG